MEDVHLHVLVEFDGLLIRRIRLLLAPHGRHLSIAASLPSPFPFALADTRLLLDVTTRLGGSLVPEWP